MASVPENNCLFKLDDFIFWAEQVIPNFNKLSNMLKIFVLRIVMMKQNNY